MHTWEGHNCEYMSLQIICGIVCVLSILGSLAIIVTYALLKEIRSKTRELLVHISLMDMTYTIANFAGIIIPYRSHLSSDEKSNSTSEDNKDYRRICEAQAFFAIYGTIGSVLWTMALAVYLYYRIVSRDPGVTKRLVVVLYVVCYAMPLYVSLWLLLDHHMGLPDNALSGAGWCSFRNDTGGLVMFMTYDIWLWLGIIVLLPLYLVIHISIRNQIKITGSTQSQHQYWIADKLAAVTKAERKLLLISLVFIFLRMWDIIDVVLFIYLKKEGRCTHYYWLQLFTAVGDSGQGAVNFIIFFLFQPTLQKYLVYNIRRCCCCCCLCRRPPRGQYDSSIVDDNGEDHDDGVETNSGNYTDSSSRTPEHFNQSTPRKYF